MVEAMKMMNVLRAERDGKVKALRANPGKSLGVDQVDPGIYLMARTAFLITIIGRVQRVGFRAFVRRRAFWSSASTAGYAIEATAASRSRSSASRTKSIS